MTFVLSILCLLLNCGSTPWILAADGTDSSASSRSSNNNDESNNDGADDTKNTNPLYLRYRGQLSTDDTVEDSLYDPIQADSDCGSADADNKSKDCRFHPPDSTIETETILVTENSIDATCSYAGADPDQMLFVEANGAAAFVDSCRSPDTTLLSGKTTTATTMEVEVDPHWGSDPTILRIRNQLRRTGSGCTNSSSRNVDGDNASKGNMPNDQNKKQKRINQRPPIFLMPGLASTRLVAWQFKGCRPHHPLLSDIKVQDYVWLNINLMMQMSTIDVSCMRECLRLGRNQTDSDDCDKGCKLRPDEGLDAISSLSLYGIGSQILMGGTNTVYKWLIQWLADHLGYDVTNIVGLPYDWRLSPDKMQHRDGFLTLTRRRIEAAVQTNGAPGIMVAHSMGNSIFRYFLSWIRKELKDEAYQRYVRQAKQRGRAAAKQHSPMTSSSSESLETGTSEAAAKELSKNPAWPLQSTNRVVTYDDVLDSHARGVKQSTFWELAEMEGDANWYDWVETHIWTYVGLSAPLLGAVNPLRAVISGENMGLPVTDADARVMELTFGSTHTVNPISTKNGFCDQWEVTDRWDEDSSESELKQHADSKLACMDDIMVDIELLADQKNNTSLSPWKNFPALKRLLRDRFDWDSNLPMIRVVQEACNETEKRPCSSNTTIDLGPKDVETGNLFTKLNSIWKEEGEPLIVKREQLRESFWDTDVINILNKTWERPLIKHVVMAYGVDVPTEVAYEYVKKQRETSDSESSGFDNMPTIAAAIWETAGGAIAKEHMDCSKAKLTDFWKKKQKRVPTGEENLHHSGDGSVPYLSLAWAHVRERVSGTLLTQSILTLFSLTM